ncbi:MAG: D-alanyl-D-alanine carboxypeptidase/D-alanyl-D-alanine-endopeptidase, partial [Phycisphaerae bacterium]|nr:D-alanyl-D-alanine carboxypeptidase/D-alanyl-D-alanine-endopeptidase [Phycisphaerae bacterium]
GDAELLRRHGWTTSTLFEHWSSLLKSRRITRVAEVVIDDGVFDLQFVHPSWPVDQQHKRYVAQIGGLNFNLNCIDFYLRTTTRGAIVQYRIDPATAYAQITNTCAFGDRNSVWLSRELGSNRIVLKGQAQASSSEPISVTVHDPGMFFAFTLSEALRASGVEVINPPVRDLQAHARQNLILLAQHETPLELVLRRANKDSINLYAECLLKRLGAASTGGRGGSWQNGATAIGAFTGERGVPPTEITIDDGSGLSRKNRLSANALTQILAADFFGPHRQTFISSLAVGGIDGTLDARFRDDLKGRVFAKTGYVANARCLSGFLRTRKDQWYAFAILVNGPVGIEGRRIQEQIVAAIDRND